ncbi:unnamed protein product [Neospora caninum Liverpool]|uniref:Uncharacterized protein n=1 Tax=Neospora caninum (strain Liverpool) TaxID=572307 RepID=F0V9A9_NEOCL|nr:uncharacterized protein NCLIV_008065 [Neospora caninum Liverpool]CBZ50334.1 unnamed protein product [Neospora caninum Liverpool]CEL64940.1 TPA: hypothetical protein BN1204_008065_1 [Neospora caninum Liverpool]|eukprot:XP_003880368.1 uncharacterized protein NCLIV_008065 [Neospora caninum Liverpool]
MHVVTGTSVQWRNPTSSTDLRGHDGREATGVPEQNPQTVNTSPIPQNSGKGRPFLADLDDSQISGDELNDSCRLSPPTDQTASAVNSKDAFSPSTQAAMNRGHDELSGPSACSMRTQRVQVNQAPVSGPPSDAPPENQRETLHLVSSAPDYVADATGSGAAGQLSCFGASTAGSISYRLKAARKEVGVCVPGFFPPEQKGCTPSESLPEHVTCSGVPATEPLKYWVLHWQFPFVLFSTLARRCVKYLARRQNHLPALRRLQRLLRFVVAATWASFPPPSSSAGPSSLPMASHHFDHDKTEEFSWISEVLPSRRPPPSAPPEKVEEVVSLVVWQPLLWVLVPAVFLLIAEHSRELDNWFERRRQTQDMNERRMKRGRELTPGEEGDGAEGNSDQLLARALVWLSRVLIVVKLGSALLEVVKQVAVFIATYCCMRYGLTWFATVLECPLGMSSSFHDRSESMVAPRQPS